jgi:5-carboxymethyl-2-hydroxymuconate isomerase
MPHLRIEYSQNLGKAIDMADFCSVMHAAILKTGLFELGAIRVRAFAAEHFAIADQLPENGFVDMQFRIGEGRSEADLKVAGDVIFAVANTELASLLSRPHFALSFSIDVMHAPLSWKKNSMHARLR